MYVEELAREEQMHMLALIAAWLGAKGLEDYETPAVRVAGWLAEETGAQARRDRIAEIAAISDGEVS